MTDRTCETCAVSLGPYLGHGRPRRFCLDCRPRSRQPVTADPLRCAHCGVECQRKSASQRFCSPRCRYAARDTPTGNCRKCAKPVYISSTSAAEPSCRDCSRGGHGTVSNYRKRGCRCIECRRANAEATKAWRPPAYRHHWISAADRIAIYDRDNWICQLCGERVDPEAPKLSRGYPTLDHIEPVSFALIPNHHPSNLRTACCGCNAARGNRVDQ